MPARVPFAAGPWSPIPDEVLHLLRRGNDGPQHGQAAGDASQPSASAMTLALHSWGKGLRRFGLPLHVRLGAESFTTYLGDPSPASSSLHGTLLGQAMALTNASSTSSTSPKRCLVLPHRLIPAGDTGVPHVQRRSGGGYRR